ncbi:MAG: SDR family oxidoreductase [Gammaproteobacteria bacterium]|nr:SDR family oxidoreductase [Gammaproteobacteria bacterium]
MTETVLITGANRGIGLELVRQYVQDGWRVFAGCRQPEKAHDLNALASRGELIVQPLDVTDARQIENLRSAVGDTPIDVLINNAGTYGQKNGGFGRTDVVAWEEAFRINIIAVMRMMEIFANAVATGHGIIANMSSKMGSMTDNTSGGSYVYRSSKAALNAITVSAARDLESRGITVVTLHPGWVRTEMGGPNALIDVHESVSGLRRVIAGLGPEQSGSFLDYRGETIPW